MFNSIKAKILLFMSLIIIVLCSVLMFAAMSMSSGIIQEEVETSLLALAQEGAKQIEYFIEGHLNRLEAVAARVEEKDQWDEQLPVLLQEVESQGHLQAGLADTQGLIRLTNGEEHDIQDRHYFQEAIQGNRFVSDPIVHQNDETVALMYAVPVLDEFGNISGVLMAARRVDDLTNITDGLGMGEDGFSFMVNGEGATIAHIDRNRIIDQTNMITDAIGAEHPELRSLFREMIRGRSGVHYYSYADVRRLAGYTPIHGMDWSIAVGAVEEEALAGVRQLRNYFLIFGIIASLVGIGISFLFTKNVL